MKTAVAFLAPAECLLVLTSSLAICRRVFFAWTGNAGGCKTSKTHTPTAGSVEWIWVTACRLFGCVRGDAPFKVLLPNGDISSSLIPIFSGTDLSQFSISHAPPLYEGGAFPRFSSPSRCDWRSLWCLPPLSLTFNSRERMHKHAQRAHTARLLMDPSAGRENVLLGWKGSQNLKFLRD